MILLLFCVLSFQLNNNNQPLSLSVQTHPQSPRARRVELRVEFRVVLRATHATHQTTQHGVCRQLHRRCCRRRKQWTGADRCGTWLQPQPYEQWGASLCFFAFLGSTGALSQPILLRWTRFEGPDWPTVLLYFSGPAQYDPFGLTSAPSFTIAFFPQTGGCSEGLGAFRFFFKQVCLRCNTILYKVPRSLMAWRVVKCYWIVWPSL